MGSKGHHLSARRFLLHELHQTIWSDYVDVNERRLAALVAERCAQPPRVGPGWAKDGAYPPHPGWARHFKGVGARRSRARSGLASEG